ncbi:hypothetical protein D9619_002295 [Psilocybe cf. subviscida]|uniref:DUF5648 domain-containing protein n=1 Tax=Psilocybe cf. subviscida TaxID=2480587 RepID=A0A8H5BGC9_9AGAR|nr:hypothetical protein D9619_002295 [Psilocybe cf. subviscida]
MSHETLWLLPQSILFEEGSYYFEYCTNFPTVTGDELQWIYTYGYVVQTEDAFQWFRSPPVVPSLVPMYRLYQNATQTHLLTASDSLRQTFLTSAQPPWAYTTLHGSVEGIAGYVYTDGSCPGTVPLLWASNSVISDNYHTIDTSEYNSFVANGYTPNGPNAWVYPPCECLGIVE